MDESNPVSFLSLSPQQLLKELETFLALEFNKSGKYWISVTRLIELLSEKYELSLEEVEKAQDYSSILRKILASNRCFSIYGTPAPEEFYIAPLQILFPGFQKPGETEILPCQAQEISEYQPIILSEINSVNDLEKALLEIVKSLKNDSKKAVTIALLSAKFKDYYQQPIRPILRSVCPDMSLIELLQTIPSIHVQQVNNDWQISVAYWC
jgi:hypothetical protein